MISFQPITRIQIMFPVCSVCVVPEGKNMEFLAPFLPLLLPDQSGYVYSLVSYKTETTSDGVAIHIIFICTNKEIMGNNFQSCDSPNKGKQGPLIRAWDEYSKGDFNVATRLR